MKLKKITIKHFRSIENVTINFPEKSPVVLFGPNNVGKSSILKALECALGEKFAPYIDFLDSDYFLRSKASYPNIHFRADFDDFIHDNPPSQTICFTTNHKFIAYGGAHKQENAYHLPSGSYMYLKNEERERCQFILIDATRDMSRQLSYFSQYSMLSRMAKRMHSVMLSQVKQKLEKNFKDLQDIFESVPQYKDFLDKLHDNFNSNVDGFEHKLEIDLSAYDPNNYFNSLRIIAKEGNDTRSFEEFGTGEQKVLVMSFMKAYAETFKGENFILGIEEPESHLHPLAQKWLAKNLRTISQGDIQIIITTHSPDFLDIEGLEGFVKVYKEENVTKTIQHDASSLAAKCTELKSAPTTSSQNILPFYKANTFTDQLKGFFANKILLVEGPSELFSLPNYFNNCGYDLVKNGIDIINCNGKSQVARNYRLFKAYDYEVFCLFDGDEGDPDNQELSDLFDFDVSKMSKTDSDFIYSDKGYGYFANDFETYLRNEIEDYSLKEAGTEGGKILKAKNLSEQNPSFKPSFIENLADFFKIKNANDSLKDSESKDTSSISEFSEIDDVPF